MQYLLFLIFITNSAIASSLYSKFSLQLDKKKDYDIQIGTGVFIDDQTILSSFHVVNNCSYIAVENNIMYPQKAILLHSNDQLDIALLKTSRHNSIMKKLYFAKQKLLSANNSIYIASFPNLESNNYVFTEAKLTKIDNFSFYFTGNFEVGNSGSPIFDKNMNLIGILTAKIETFNIQQELIATLNQATHISAFKKLIKDHDIENSTQKTRLNFLQNEDHLKINLVKIYCLKY